MSTKHDVELAYIKWAQQVDDPEFQREILGLLRGAFDDDDEAPSKEVIDLLVSKKNWDELRRLGFDDLCPDEDSEDEFGE
jgi:hypothetical protein